MLTHTRRALGVLTAAALLASGGTEAADAAASTTAAAKKPHSVKITKRQKAKVARARKAAYTGQAGTIVHYGLTTHDAAGTPKSVWRFEGWREIGGGQRWRSIWTPDVPAPGYDFVGGVAWGGTKFMANKGYLPGGGEGRTLVTLSANTDGAGIEQLVTAAATTSLENTTAGPTINGRPTRSFLPTAELLNNEGVRTVVYLDASTGTPVRAESAFRLTDPTPAIADFTAWEVLPPDADTDVLSERIPADARIEQARS